MPPNGQAHEYPFLLRGAPKSITYKHAEDQLPLSNSLEKLEIAPIGSSEKRPPSSKRCVRGER